MITSKAHPDSVQKALIEFYKHAKEQGAMCDTTAVTEQGDDTHYYELDARYVEPLLELLEKYEQL